MDFITNENQKTAKQKTSFSAKVLIAVTGGVAVGLSVVCASFVAPAFRRYCLPYVPATPKQIKNVLSFLPENGKGKLLDIGSGDGRIVIAAAKRGIHSEGVELNTWLVLYSRLAALRHRVGSLTAFHRRDLWKFNVSNYSHVVVFGVEQMMQDLERKLLKELPKDAHIIACRFPLPELEFVKSIGDGHDTVWLYKLDQSKQSNPERKTTVGF